MVHCSHDYTGERFGSVTIIGRAEDHIQPSGRIRIMWLCKCDCGKEYTCRDDAVKNIASCGCQRNRDNAIRMTKNSESRTRLYRIYYSMIGRCHNPRNSDYGRYGGRGISVCQEWRDDNTSFFRWAKASGYVETDNELSLERIHVDGDYCPENCTWIRLKDQYNNRRNTIRMGNISLKKFCDNAGLNYGQVFRKYKQTNDIVYAVGLIDRPTTDTATAG